MLKITFDVQDIDAIATTVKPGLALSLTVGLDYGRQMARDFKSVHHVDCWLI